MSVAEYFASVKRIPLRYPKLPLLHVGPPQKNTMVPMEVSLVKLIRGNLSTANEKETVWTIVLLIIHYVTVL